MNHEVRANKKFWQGRIDFEQQSENTGTQSILIKPKKQRKVIL